MKYKVYKDEDFIALFTYRIQAVEYADRMNKREKTNDYWVKAV